jgi:hypothetical protein
MIVVDYKNNDPLDEIPHGSVDVLLDSTAAAVSYVSFCIFFLKSKIS